MTEEFEYVSSLLKEPIGDEPEQLIKDLEAIEVWNARMQFLLAASNYELDRLRFNRMPQKENKTEFERRIELDSEIAAIKENRDKIEGVCEAIKTRITLGQSILKYYSSTQNIQYKNDNQKTPW